VTTNDDSIEVWAVSNGRSRRICVGANKVAPDRHRLRETATGYPIFTSCDQVGREPRSSPRWRLRNPLGLKATALLDGGDLPCCVPAGNRLPLRQSAAPYPGRCVGPRVLHHPTPPEGIPHCADCAPTHTNCCRDGSTRGSPTPTNDGRRSPFDGTDARLPAVPSGTSYSDWTGIRGTGVPSPS